ncbi:Ger(x)C family spore germination protein [Haloimpatiens sp. FM7315]|uniref:Ger(x)C family spore germination protein n=1 Tax=Haloimpatiens sp. FM7315 TaxID=3298609 RepID=UPI00370BA1F8
MKKKYLIMSVCVIIMELFFCGCWDKVEIDKRVFISTIGIDIGEDIEKSKTIQSSQLEFLSNKADFKKLKVSYSFPDLKKVKDGLAETESKSVDAYSLTDASNKFAVQSSRSLYMGHTKLLMFSSDLLKYKDTVKEIIDYIKRQPDFNRTVLVLVCEGKLEDYYKLKPKMEKNLEDYIMGIMSNSQENSAIPEVNLNEFLYTLSENGNSLVPMISINKNKNEVMLKNMAIIKDYEMVGKLGEEDVAQRQMLNGKLKSGSKVVLYESHPVDYIIDGSNRNIKFFKANGKFVFNININLEGKINACFPETKLLSEKNLDQIESKINKLVEEESKRFIEVSKEKYKSDFIGLDDHLKKYHPKVWNEVKDNSKEKLRNSVIIVNVKSDIRRVGVSQ